MIKLAQQRHFVWFSVSNFCLRIFVIVVAVNVSAQQVEQQGTIDKQHEIIVTGSRISKIDIARLSPVLSISREEMDKFGYANVKDAIDNLTQNSGGTFDNGFTFGFTPGASSVNLRGLGFGQTLTLIDGRRLPIYPIGFNGTSNFVDLSAIPMAFVERIEILTNSASAVYGSDAVAGVINIITRKNIEGIKTNFRTSFTSDGGYQTQRFNLVTGAHHENTQLDVILDYWLQKPMWATDRNYASSDIANSRGNLSFGGASFIGFDSLNITQAPNCGSPSGALSGQGIANVEFSVYSDNDIWCGFDRSTFRQLIAPQERISLMSRFQYDISKEVSFFSRVGLSQLITKTQFEANLYGGAELNGFGSLTPNFGGILPPGAATNPTTGSTLEEPGVFIRRLVEFGPRTSKINNDSINLLAGFKGSLANGAYDWEFGTSYNKTELDIDSNNIFLSALNAAVDNGLDLFQPIPSQTVDRLSFIANQKASSTNQVYDFSISGDLDLILAGGPIKFALMLEYVNERYIDRPDPILLNGDGFDGSSEGKGKRRHIGIGGELNLPILDDFDLALALRWDDYKDASKVNSALSPRISLGYNITESLLTRISWGRSFRAPDMQRLFGGVSRGFNDLIDPDNPVTSDGRVNVVQSVQIFTLSNIELSEERGSNINLGFVWQATSQLDFSIDMFYISLNDVVAAPSAQFIVNACSQFEVLCDFVFRDASGSLNGNEAFVVTGPLNFAKQETEGIDFTVNYDWQNDLGNWNTRLTTTWIRAFYFTAVEGLDKVDNVDLGLIPEYRATLVLDWQNESMGATFKMNFIDEIAGAFCGDCNKSEYIDAWVTLDANFRVQFTQSSRLSLGINNLTNEAPPQDPTQNNWPWFSNAGSFYNAIGRELYLQLDMNF